MPKKEIRKIIYFDKETIRNILQEQHHGDYTKIVEANTSVHEYGNRTIYKACTFAFTDRGDLLVCGEFDQPYGTK